tara:strand:- start:262 stop:633 length:372 start_codon:yes stop_codon:yes gene_type:complete
MATKTILNTTDTRVTFAVSGTFDLTSVDFDLDVDSLGRDETVENPQCIILQVDYDNNVGDLQIYRVTTPNLTPVFTFSGAGVGSIINTGQLGLSAEPDKDLRIFIEDGTVTITLKKVSGFTQL